MEVKHVAACTVTILAIATIGTIVAAAKTASLVATVIFGLLATLFAGVSIAAITAAFDAKSLNAESYFEKIKEHSVYAVGAMFQFVGQTLFQALIRGFAEGIANAISNKIGGEKKYTVQMIH